MIASVAANILSLIGNKIAAGAFGAAGLFYMIAMAVYADLTDDSCDGCDFHVSFAFTVMAWLLSWVAAAIGIVSSK